MTEQETHTEWGVRTRYGNVMDGEEGQARAFSKVDSSYTLVSRQVTDWTPVEEPARMVEPTEFGSMVMALDEGCPSRERWIGIRGVWYDEHGCSRTWAELVDPRPYTPDGAS